MPWIKPEDADRELSSLVERIALAGGIPTVLRRLAGAVSGGIAYAVIIGYESVILAPGKALSTIADSVGGAISSSVTRIATVVQAQVGGAWSANLDLGLFQLPYAVIALLVAFFALAYMIDVFWRQS